MSAAPATLITTNWGKRLRTRRIELGLTQVTFADKVGRDQTTISRYEHGEGPWTPEVMLGFAVALDRSVPDLFPWPVGIEDAERFRQGASRQKASA